MDLGAPVLEQIVLSLLITERAGIDEATRTRLRDNRDWLHAALAERMPEWKIRKQPGGMSLWCNLPAPRSMALAAEARKSGLALTPGSVFAVDDHGLDRWLRVPYALDRSELEVALPLLAGAWAAVA